LRSNLKRVSDTIAAAETGERPTRPDGHALRRRLSCYVMVSDTYPSIMERQSGLSGALGSQLRM
jgi:hypothetical protein